MMTTEIDGVRWRLRFRHTQKPVGSGSRGVTQCWVEVWEKHVELEGWFSVPGAYGETRCGRRDNFTRETGRQFSMIRALRGLLLRDVTVNSAGELHSYKPHISALILAYARSAPDGRLLCDDLRFRGFRSLYDAVFDPDRLWEWHANLRAAELAELDAAIVNLLNIPEEIVENVMEQVV